MPASARSAGRDCSTGDGLEPVTRVRYFGDYELLKVIGEGGMGIVYRAKQLSLNRPVAVKMIRATRFASAEDVRRFKNEAEAVARLDHPNIVPIFEVGQFEDQHYFSMKLISGESLDKRLNDYMTDSNGAARLVATAASAILHAHQRGILHRDLKPANILVDCDGQPHVTDFGLAKRVEGDSDLTRSGAILGTPAYMAPEQASGRRGSVTTSTDIYGLGAILYALLTGKAPFSGTTVLDTLEQVRERSPDLPRKLNPRAPRDLEVICLKCLEKEPRRRYASADSLAEDLKRWLAGEPIAARPVGRSVRFGMWCRRNPILALGTGVLVTALVVVSALSLLYARQQARLTQTTTLYAVEQTRRADDQAAAAAKIAGLNKNLEAGSRDLNRRLAMLQFERAQRAFDSGQINHGLLWLIESWGSATEAGDREWQHLVRTNLSFWRYCSPEIKGVFSKYAGLSRDRTAMLTRSKGKAGRLWDVATGRPIGQLISPDDGSLARKLSPDGRTAVFTSTDGKTVRLWDATSGRPVGQPMVHEHSVSSIVYSPDGKTVLTVSPQTTARLWNASTGVPFGRPMVNGSEIQSVAFSPAGKSVLTKPNGSWARLWDVANGEPIGKPLTHGGGHVFVAAFSPDGKFVITGTHDRAQIWNASTGLPIGPPMVHDYEVYCASFSPDGKTILTAGDNMSARLWDAVTGLPIGPRWKDEDSGKSSFGRLSSIMSDSFYSHELSGRSVSVAFSPDSKTFLVWSPYYSKVRLGSSTTGLPVGKQLEHQATVTTVAFSPDGKTIVTGSRDKLARLWDAATGLLVGQPMLHEDEVVDVAFGPDGSEVLTGAVDGTARLWSASAGPPMGQPLIDSVYYAAFSPDGDKLVTIGENVRTWNTAARVPMGQPIAPSYGFPGAQVGSAVFSRDGKTIRTVSHSGVARRWDASTGRAAGQPNTSMNAEGEQTIDLRRRGNRGLRLMAVSPDGDTILSVTDENHARLWKANSGETVMDQVDVISAVFSPDSKSIAIGSRSGAARIWDTSTGRSIGAPMEHGGPVLAMAFSSDGKIITTGCEDGTARLWYTSSNRPAGSPLMHQGPVRSVAFSPDGSSVLTVANKILMRWDVAAIRPIGQPKILQRVGDSVWFRPGGNVAFCPDGKTILAASDNKGARLWDLATGEPIGPILADEGEVRSVAFSPNGRTVVTVGDSASYAGKVFSTQTMARVWHLPSLIDDDLIRIKAWIETITGMSIDDEGKISPLETVVWQERRESLRRVGGPPETDYGWLLDPVLSGPDPTARARGWIERGCWAEAETAFADVIRADPSLSSVWIERGRFYLMRSDLERASADFVRALALGNGQRADWNLLADIVPRDNVFDRVVASLPSDATALPILFFLRADHLARKGKLELARDVLLQVGAAPWQGLGLTVGGLHPGEMFALLGCPDQLSALLSRYQRTTNPREADQVAWCCALAPGVLADPEAPVRLGELAVRGFPAERRDLALNTLGAVLYRAGRSKEAISHLEEAIKARDRAEVPADWAFLAMAHHRLGHREEARRWLDRLRERQPSTDPDEFWGELEIRLLRSEAEAVILYDPEFPVDPFAH
jgi:WD40 repeat protein/tRNA A-37 threonylcarbamoyl transferase component Bud32/tetratricopeptide (TPR) repeat protein